MDDSEESSQTSDDDDDDAPQNYCAAKMEVILNAVNAFYTTNKDIIKKVSFTDE
jgi:hypothetical protein